MQKRQGFTIIELIVVLIIIGAVTAFCLPNFTTPNEKARALNAKNNLLAIYSAEQNYLNNYSAYCTTTTGNTIPCADNLSDINTYLSLQIQDDGSYTYSCSATTDTCTAVRSGTTTTNSVVTLNAATQLNGNVNPQCNTANNWCP